MGLFSSIFGGGDQEVTQKSAPWGPAQPDIKDYMALAALLSKMPYKQYQGATVAPLSNQTLQGIGQMEQFSKYGSPIMNQAQGGLSRFMNPQARDWSKMYGTKQG